MVRGHLRSLASKLIEEVDTLRSQTAASQAGSTSQSLMLLPPSQLPAGQLTNASNSAAWKNRCSERRERINAQNMQIALEKEFQAKEQLVEENNNLKQESDTRQHRINDMQTQIEQLNKELAKNNAEIKALKEDLSQKSPSEVSMLNSSVTGFNEPQLNGPSTNSLSSLSSSNTTSHVGHVKNDSVKLSNITNGATSGVTGQMMVRQASIVSTHSSTIYSMPPNERDSQVCDENCEPVKNENVNNGKNVVRIQGVFFHKYTVKPRLMHRCTLSNNVFNCTMEILVNTNFEKIY